MARETRDAMATPAHSLSVLSERLGRAIVISKAGPHPRKQQVQEALEAVGLSFDFQDAVMGADLAPGELAACYDAEAALRHRTGPRRLHASMVGCFLSHADAWREVVQRHRPAALILEDDVVPVPGNESGVVAAAIAELPADWDLLYLGVRGQRVAPRSFAFKRWLFLPWARLLFPRKYRFTPAEYGRLYQRPFSALLNRAGYHQGTHAYAVSHRGAEKLLAQMGRISAPPDTFLGCLVLEDKLNAFALRKDLFTVSGAPSQVVSSLR
jgi:glycosyl transferase family 25